MTPAPSPNILFDSEGLNKIIGETVRFFSFITSAQIQEHLFVVKLIFIFFSVLFLIGLIYFLIKTDYLETYYFISWKEMSEFKDFGKKKWEKRWNKIKKQLGRASETYQKLALLEAQKLFSDALTEQGYGSGSLDEKLKQLTEEDVSNLQQIFQANQVCQNIIHDPDYRLRKEKAEEVVMIFEKGLFDIGVL